MVMRMSRSFLSSIQTIFALIIIMTFFFFFFFFFNSWCFYLHHKASVKLFVSLKFLNVRQSVGLLGGGSARRKVATYTQNSTNTE
jgi:hypothetical protein